MTDYTELKRLAETANAVTGDVSVDIAISSERGPNQPEIDAVTAFVGAATPAVVMALIAENKRLTAELDCPFRLARHSKRLVEQLRAEVAGLKTGYEAYERVNAELKAEVEWLQEENENLRTCSSSVNAAVALENEALRKHQPSVEVIWCACGDGYPANSYGAGFMDANGGVCQNCDAALPMVSCPLELFETLLAAMGQGEKS